MARTVERRNSTLIHYKGSSYEERHTIRALGAKQWVYRPDMVPIYPGA